MNKKYIVIGLIVVAILGIFVGFMVGGTESQPLGRAANNLPNGYWNTADGYYVDGVAVINGSGAALVEEPVATPTADATLTIAQSGTTFNLGTAGVDLTLPAVATAAGVKYKFVISAAFASTNITVVSAAGDDIEGSLVVAGAVVDCDASDVITFVADGENLGDFVEIFSNGTNWFIGQSGALTGSKLTCTG